MKGKRGFLKGSYYMNEMEYYFDDFSHDRPELLGNKFKVIQLPKHETKIIVKN